MLMRDPSSLNWVMIIGSLRKSSWWQSSHEPFSSDPKWSHHVESFEMTFTRSSTDRFSFLMSRSPVSERPGEGLTSSKQWSLLLKTAFSDLPRDIWLPLDANLIPHRTLEVQSEAGCSWSNHLHSLVYERLITWSWWLKRSWTGLKVSIRFEHFSPHFLN